MKTIKVEVCVCTNCVMNGAMNIIEAIEGVAALEKQLRIENNIVITTSKKLADDNNGEKSPVVRINGELLYRTNTETVMAKIIALTSKDVVY